MQQARPSGSTVGDHPRGLVKRPGETTSARLAMTNDTKRNMICERSAAGEQATSAPLISRSGRETCLRV